MLMPKRTKHRKMMRGRNRGVSLRGATVSFGEFGLKALEVGWVTSKQIEAGRRTITHALKRGGRVWIRIFPDKPVTARAAGQRMGSGKGEIDRYVCVVKPGRVMYEVSGPSKEIIVEALKKAADKMPIKTTTVARD